MVFPCFRVFSPARRFEKRPADRVIYHGTSFQIVLVILSGDSPSAQSSRDARIRERLCYKSVGEKSMKNELNFHVEQRDRYLSESQNLIDEHTEGEKLLLELDDKISELQKQSHSASFSIFR